VKQAKAGLTYHLKSLALSARSLSRSLSQTPRQSTITQGLLLSAMELVIEVEKTHRLHSLLIDKVLLDIKRSLRKLKVIYQLLYLSQ